MKKFLLLISVLVIPMFVLADEFVPDFDDMKVLRCEIEESIYDVNDNLISKNNIRRIYRLDDTNSKIYLQKEPIDRVVNYDKTKIEFYLQTMTDESIAMVHTIIDRGSNKYSSIADITYDNPYFGKRLSKSIGFCKVID